MPDFLQTVKERVVVYDGAMGTNIQSRNPTLDDYWGKENCSEVLVLSRPDIIRDIHADFFRVGCDIVETDTFGGSAHRSAEFELADQGARDQREGGQAGSEKSRSNFRPKTSPRFVAGSMGPTTKLPSLGHIGFEAMVGGICGAGRALIEGGVDLLLIETCQDLLQAKIATIGVLEAMQQERQAPAGDSAGHAARERHHAAGHGNWRGADGAGAVRCGHSRAELRHRTERDE